MLNKRMNKGV